MSRFPTPLLLTALAGCTDYGFAGKHVDPDDGDYTVLADTSDTEWTDDDTGPPHDTANDTGDTADTGGDTGGSDGCYDPESGYEGQPESQLYTLDATTPLTVQFIESSTSYSDELDLDAPAWVKLFYAYSDAPGSTLSVGPYSSGAEVIFGIDVLNTGEHWQSGPASRNSDGVAHVSVAYEGSCTWRIGFEDLTGGGDLDFNDVVMRVSGMLRQGP